MSQDKIKLVVGLGNPGDQYQNTRHNLGFRVLDALAENDGAVFKNSPKFHGQTAWLLSGRADKTLLLKPELFYNQSGRSVREAGAFYNIGPQEILVIHDELFLPLGAIRLRLGGRDSGNNGIKSIIGQIGANFWRLRLGIDGQQRVVKDDTSFVLGRFDAAERAILPKIIAAAMALAQELAGGQSPGHHTVKIDTE